MQCLAIVRRCTERYSETDFEPVLEPEAEAIRALYAQGVVRTVWSRQDVPGAALVLEAADVDEARRIIDTFPLIVRDMAELEALIPLRGYRGFGPRA